MANTDYQDKLSLFHSFSKTPVVSTLGLGNAINKSGHTVSSTEVWSDEIPYFGILSAVSDLESKVAPYAAKNDICKVGSTYYIRNGVEYSADKSTAELWDTITLTDGLVLKNRFDKDVIKYHSGKQLSDLTGDNNANTDSNHYAARLWTSEGLIEQFVGPTDKALNGLASVGYTPTVYNNGTKIVEGTDYSMVTFSGTVLWNAQHNSGTRTIDCFEYIGAKVSESITGINETIKNLSIQAGAGIGVSVDGNEASTGIHNIEFKKSDEITISQSTNGAKTDITIGVDLSNVENAIKANEIKVADGSGLTIDKAVDGSGTTIGVDTSVLATKASVDGVANDLAALTTTVGKNKVLAGNGISVSEGENGTTVSADTTVVATKSSVDALTSTVNTNKITTTGNSGVTLGTPTENGTPISIDTSVIATKASVDTVAGNVATLTETVNSNKVTTTTGSGIIIGSATTANGTPLSIDTNVIATKSTVDALTSRIENLENVKLDVVVLGTSDALPTGEDIRVNTIYLKQDSNAADGSYIEYIGYLNGSTKAIEKIGSTKIDLDGYVKTIRVNGTDYNVGAGTTTVDIGSVIKGVTNSNYNTENKSSNALGFNVENDVLSLYLAIADGRNIGVVGISGGSISSVQQYYANYVAISANAFETNKEQTDAAITNVETTLSNDIRTKYTILSNEISSNYTALSNKIADVESTAGNAIAEITPTGAITATKSGNTVTVGVKSASDTQEGVVKLFNLTSETLTGNEDGAASASTVKSVYDRVASAITDLNNGTVKSVSINGATYTPSDANGSINLGSGFVKGVTVIGEATSSAITAYVDQANNIAILLNPATTTGQDVTSDYGVVKTYYGALSHDSDLGEVDRTLVPTKGSVERGLYDVWKAALLKTDTTYTKGVKVGANTYNATGNVVTLPNLVNEVYTNDVTGLTNGVANSIVAGSVDAYGKVKIAAVAATDTQAGVTTLHTVTANALSTSSATGAASVQTVKNLQSNLEDKIGRAITSIVVGNNSTEYNEYTGSGLGIGPKGNKGEQYLYIAIADDSKFGTVKLFDSYMSSLLYDGLGTQGKQTAVSTFTLQSAYFGLADNLRNEYSDKVSYLVAGNAIELGYHDGNNGYKISAKDATSTEKGVMKLYSTSTNATDGTVTAAVVDTIKGQVEQLMNIAHLQVKVVTSLPEGAAITANTLYLIKETGSIDTYVEYISYKANESDTNFSLERIGTTKTDLNGFASTITVNGQTNTVTNNSVNLGNIVRGISTSSSALTLGGTNEAGITIDVKGASSSQAGVAKLFTLTPATLGAENVSSAYAGAASVATVSDFYKEIHQTVETLYLSNSGKITDLTNTVSSNYTALSDAIAAVKTTADGAIQTITSKNVETLTVDKNGSEIKLGINTGNSSHAGVVGTYTLTAAQVVEPVYNEDWYVPTVKTVRNIYNELDTTKLDKVVINGIYGTVGSSGGVHQGFYIKATNNTSTIDKSCSDGWGLSVVTKDGNIIVHDGFIGERPFKVGESAYGIIAGGAEEIQYVLPQGTSQVVNNFAFNSVGNILDSLRPERMFSVDAYMFEGSNINVWCADLPNARKVDFSNLSNLYEFTGDLSSLIYSYEAFANDGELRTFVGDVSNSIDTGYMFYGCESLTSVISDFSSATTCGNMFNGCTSLYEISADFSSFEFNGVNPFYDATNLETFNGSLESVTGGSKLFKGKSKLKSVTTNLKNLEDGYEMFASCAALTTFIGDTSSMTSAVKMFDGCQSLNTINMNLGSLVEGENMFYNCKSITSFGGDLQNLQNGGGMFVYCSSLTSFNCGLPSLTNGDNMFYGCKLDLESVQNIADTINTPATKGSITIGVDVSLQGGADLATAIAAIEAKNWTVTVQYN